MIVGVFLRGYKSYYSPIYIPLSVGDKFSAILGKNGVGKTAILEALDCFFNEENWNFNNSVKRSGLGAIRPRIAVMFCLEKSKIDITDEDKYLDEMSQFFWDMDKGEDFEGVDDDGDDDRSEDLKPETNSAIFIKQKKYLSRHFSSDKYYLFCIGIEKTKVEGRQATNYYFENFRKIKPRKEEDLSIKFDNFMQLLVEEVRCIFDYIYLPSDLSSADLTRLTGKQIQNLMGEALIKKIDPIVSRNVVNSLNDELNKFLDNLNLSDLAYRVSQERQPNLKKSEISSLIIESFFEKRKLHRYQEVSKNTNAAENWISIDELSSGEKQLAITEVAYQLTDKHNANSENLILAIDEPENSLHMSACFEHFLFLQDFSSKLTQLFCTTHWYGFLPVISEGSATVINKERNKSRLDFLPLSNYLEEIKEIRGKNVPYDLNLKSKNDFIQSIVASLMGDNPFNWLICEGSTESIYFNSFIGAKKLKEKRVRIVPLGGAKEVIKTYKHLIYIIDNYDFKNELKGKVFFLIDTDQEIIDIDVKCKSDKISFKRLYHDGGSLKVDLCKAESLQGGTPTDIERSLKLSFFIKALELLKDEEAEVEEILSNMRSLAREDDETLVLENPSLSQGMIKSLKDLFSLEGFKFKFSQAYVAANVEGNAKPRWFNEIEAFLLEDQ